MGTPYVGEILAVAFNFAPANWAFCNGALLSISQNEVLFSLLGTTYGGDGVNTFALPDLQGRVAVHQGTLSGGSTYVQGQKSGVENVTVLQTQLPAHVHPINVVPTDGDDTMPNSAYFAASAANQFPPIGAATMGNMVLTTGGSQPHNNIQPTLAMYYIIALYGVYPSQG